MVYKELERVLKEKGSLLSPEKVIEVAETIFSVSIKVPATGEVVAKTIILSQEQKRIAELFDFCTLKRIRRLGRCILPLT